MEKNISEKQTLKILFLASEPTDAGKLRLGAELQKVRDLLSKNDYFEIEDRQAVKPEDVQQTILNYKPNIVHFSGHGQDSGEICFEDEQGKSKVIPPDVLADLFNLVKDHVKCVLVNTCYSDKQAKAIAKYIPIVIGTKKEISDAAAISFSMGFYTALASNVDISQKNLKEAFGSGLIAIKFKNLPEELTPIIIEGSPEVRFASEVDTAFIPISKPKGLAFQALLKGLTLTGRKMGVSDDVVLSVLESKINKLKLHNDAVVEYENYLKDILRDEYPLSDASLAALQQLQYGLDLSHEDVLAIKNKVLSNPNLNSPEKWYDRGRGQSDLGNHERAIDYYTNAIEKDSDYSGAYFERGYSHERIQEFDLAVEDFTKAINFNNKWELSSNLSSAYYSRGHAYFSMKSDDEVKTKEFMTLALQDWSKSIELNPNEPNAYHNRGLVYEYFNDMAKAITEFKKAFDMSNDEMSKKTTAARLARCHSILGNIEETRYWTKIVLDGKSNNNPSADDD